MRPRIDIDVPSVNSVNAVEEGLVNLTYAPEDPYPGYGQILVNVDDFREIPTLTSRAQTELDEILPAYNAGLRSEDTRKSHQGHTPFEWPILLSEATSRGRSS